MSISSCMLKLCCHHPRRSHSLLSPAARANRLPEWPSLFSFPALSLIHWLLTNCATLAQVEDALSSVVVAQLLFLEAESSAPISLYINSPGGSVTAGMAIYDTVCPTFTQRGDGVLTGRMLADAIRSLPGAHDCRRAGELDGFAHLGWRSVYDSAAAE